ncbi:hypothetical protein GCM10029964_083750 [Kibdelosporangium lantanae]
MLCFHRGQPRMTTFPDDVEQVLRKAYDLIGSAITLRTNNSAVEAVSGTVAAQVAALLVDQAERTVAAVVPASTDSASLVYQALRAHIGQAPRAVPVRLLCPRSRADRGFVREFCGAGGVDVRCADTPPMAAILVGRAAAVVRPTTAVGWFTFRGTELVAPVRSLFDLAWGTSTPVATTVELADERQALLVRQVLATLLADVSDEAAARQLAMSVRKYRGHVAEIMVMLGARSRFQLGVRAAAHGLLS